MVYHEERWNKGKPYTNKDRAAGCFAYAVTELVTRKTGRFNTITNPASAFATTKHKKTTGIRAPGNNGTGH